ncbi:uncharacterized protein LOC131431507 [Malaya genurostris]|uniref:uncharacterized protein LOC131431507 n=1 Tax=Malaya genurostris TaxID=325434 RepID=UPI0026F38872|nr:uncharacterized protein LOC131431507 [Malaya genurostris]
MKPSPKKSFSSKLKHRSKSNNAGGTSIATASAVTAAANAISTNTATSNNVANNTSGHSHSHNNHSTPLMRTGGSDTNSSGNDGNIPTTAKDKVSYQSYAGLSSRSVRTIWEQHDKQETEVSSEVYSKLAEDTTYKLWELANNIKTYSRHSSGKVTYALVNEVLKDCDIPPIIGANNEPWDKIEYDGVYFFNSDEVLDLREEYIKDVTMEQSNIPVLTTSWMAESAIAEDLIELYNNVCDAVYIGDEECFEEAVGILTTNPHVPSLMKLLLTKAIEMLGFEYTENTLIRSLQFLEAVVMNDHVSHSDLTLELSLLSQIFVSLLLGAPNTGDQARFIPAQQLSLELQSQNQQLQPLSMAPNGTDTSLGSVPTAETNMDHIQSGFNQSSLISMNVLNNNLTGPSEDSNNSNSNATEELLRSIEHIKEGPDGIDINNIKDEYEALFSMVQGLGKQETGDDQENVSENDGFQIKTEFGSEFDTSSHNFMIQQSAPVAEDAANYEIKQEHDTKLKLEDPEEDVSLQMSESTGGEVINPNSTTLESENIVTLMCSDHLVDHVCRVIGLCSSKWGFVEQECTFLLVDRLQRYFDDKKHSTLDYIWFSRMLRGLWSLGEFAFRELSPYFEQIDPDSVVELVNCHINNAGIFLRGPGDIFFYEYLSELCGDGLLPFTFHYEHCIEERHQFLHRVGRAANTSKHRYKIHPKILLKTHRKSSSLKPPPTVNDLFPERSERQLESIATSTQQVPSARFSFRVAGCRPVALKSSRHRLFRCGRSSLIVTGNTGGQDNQDFNSPPPVSQNDAMLRSFQAKVVIVRRKLLPPDTNHYHPQRIYCYGSTVL